MGGNLLGIPHRYLGKQYTGVFGTKTLIRILFPHMVKLCDECSRIHDEAYDQDDPLAWNYIDWSKGADATLEADMAWRECSFMAVQDQPDTDELECQIEKIAYPTIRKWGKARAWLWKHGVRY